MPSHAQGMVDPRIDVINVVKGATIQRYGAPEHIWSDNRLESLTRSRHDSGCSAATGWGDVTTWNHSSASSAESALRSQQHRILREYPQIHNSSKIFPLRHLPILIAFPDR